MAGNESGKAQVILDLDTGIDDAMAIAYVLGSPDAELVGITCTYGNVEVGRSVRNSLALTELLGHPEVPVYRGLGHALASDGFEVLPSTLRIHGANGIGEVAVPEPTRDAEKTPAVDLLVRAAHELGERLVYVPTGPLTNLAAALRRDPEIANLIGRVVLMGGALTQPGNVSACAEANISQDPEAADEVFRSGIRVMMVGLDVTHQTLLTREQTARWRALRTAAGRAYADMVDYYIGAYAESAPQLGGCALHDPLAAAVALDSSLVRTLPINLKVDLVGPTRGRTIGDEERLNDPEKTCEAALEVDAVRFLGHFMERMGRALGAGE